FGDEDRVAFGRDVRDDYRVRVALNLCWMPVSAPTLIRDLFAQPHLLDHAARTLTDQERALLRRDRRDPFTDADVPLLDEAAELLGDMPGGQRGDSSGETTREELDYARQVLDSFGGDGMVTAESLAARMKGQLSRGTVAERAARDRSWTYGHVVVDEAQELSPMAWRMLVRRCPTRSFTIVGDVAQTTSSAGTRWWPEIMDPLFKDTWQLRELTISYRIPAAVARAAQGFARAAGLPVSDLRAAREVKDAVTAVQCEDVLSEGARRAGTHLAALASSGGGTVAMVVPDGHVEAARTHLSEDALSDDALTVVTARESKGLEFDVTVVVEPAVIAMRPGDLYVALTRCTQRLDMVHRQPLPAGLTTSP
ncbi:MAG: AAA family ATPase, partial [Demequina sp.]